MIWVSGRFFVCTFSYEPRNDAFRNREDSRDFLVSDLFAKHFYGTFYRTMLDPLLRRINAYLVRWLQRKYQRLRPIKKALACWQRITAPVMWVEGDQTDVSKWWGNRYPRSEFDARLAVLKTVEKHVLSPAGHMLHHDQPEELARRVEAFLL